MTEPHTLFMLYKDGLLDLPITYAMVFNLYRNGNSNSTFYEHQLEEYIYDVFISQYSCDFPDKERFQKLAQGPINKQQAGEIIEFMKTDPTHLAAIAPVMKARYEAGVSEISSINDWAVFLASREYVDLYMEENGWIRIGPEDGGRTCYIPSIEREPTHV